MSRTVLLLLALTAAPGYAQVVLYDSGASGGFAASDFTIYGSAGNVAFGATIALDGQFSDHPNYVSAELGRGLGWTGPIACEFDYAFCCEPPEVPDFTLIMGLSTATSWTGSCWLLGGDWLLGASTAVDVACTWPDPDFSRLPVQVGYRILEDAASESIRFEVTGVNGAEPCLLPLREGNRAQDEQWLDFYLESCFPVEITRIRIVGVEGTAAAQAISWSAAQATYR